MCSVADRSSDTQGRVLPDSFVSTAGADARRKRPATSVVPERDNAFGARVLPGSTVATYQHLAAFPTRAVSVGNQGGALAPWPGPFRVPIISLERAAALAASASDTAGVHPLDTHDLAGAVAGPGQADPRTPCCGSVVGPS